MLDADDYFDTQVFDEFISFLKKQNVDLVINDFSIVDEEAKRLEEYNFNLPASKSFTLSDFPKGIHEWIWHHAMTYSSSILIRFNITRQRTFRTRTMNGCYCLCQW